MVVPSGDGDDLAVGIDLGTTNSVIAVIRDGQALVIPDAAGNRLHPSVVTFKPSGDRLVGAGARLRRVVDPRNTIFSVKRLIGLPFDSPAVKAALPQLPYEVREGPDGAPVVVTRTGPHAVIEISSFLLGYLREQAEQYLGTPVTRCVITVPANFSDGQREATRRAGELAGFRVLRVLNEPTAAALAYGLGQKINQRVAVFDMGGGTFDVTLLAVRNDFFEVLGTGGDPFLGGDDMDQAIADMLALEFLKRHRVDFRTDPRALAVARITAEHIKARLSSDDVISGTLKDLGRGEGGEPLPLEFRITRAELEHLITPIVDRALAKCEEVLAEAGVRPDHVDEVMLVGGATRIPLVRRRVAELFGREPRADIDPMEVVAEGAARQAEILSAPATAQGAAMPILVDVTPHPIGIGTAGGYCEVVIDKNEPIPSEHTHVFSTARDGQTEVVIRVCQGAARVFATNTVLGEVRLDGLRAADRGEVRIEVTFLIDANGILQVTARDLVSGRAAHATLRAAGGETR
ncbi:MAG: dnaK [Deltaproteobacteria bacterium]|nr:dnaK [Deltaproteobacteria bacterium]